MLGELRSKFVNKIERDIEPQTDLRQKVRIVREKGDQSMTLTINTNIASIIAERNLNSATNTLNKSLERLSTGYKINHASDNAAGYSIADMWDTQISSLDIAAANAATGNDLLTTAEQTYGLLTSHLQRIRDLAVQAGNGTYGSQSLRAIQSEIYARLEEISRISANSEFNGIKLMSYATDKIDVGFSSDGINLQVGLYADDNSVINLDVSLFKNASVSGLFAGMTESIQGVTLQNMMDAAKGDQTLSKYNTEVGYAAFAAACSGLKISGGTTAADFTYALQNLENREANKMIGFIDNAIQEISNRITKIGAAQNRVDSALGAIDVQSQNLTSSLSTLRDTDVASESSKYIQAQILQQASATLLATANQTPSIALNLL